MERALLRVTGRSDEVRLLQIWLTPQHLGSSPSYEQRQFPTDSRSGKLVVVAPQDGRDDSVSIDADVSLYSGLFAPGDRAEIAIAAGRYPWVQVVSGELQLDVGDGSARLQPGDGAAISEETALRLEAIKESEVLVFDLV